MSFNTRQYHELQSVLSRGGGLKINGSGKQTGDLETLASYAANGHARLTITGMGSRKLDELERIAIAGRGSVSFED